MDLKTRNRLAFALSDVKSALLALEGVDGIIHAPGATDVHNALKGIEATLADNLERKA